MWKGMNFLDFPYSLYSGFSDFQSHSRLFDAVWLPSEEAFPLGMAENISKKKPEARIEVYQIKKSTN
jgi:hypothetical protein